MLKTKRILLFLLLLMIIAGTMTGCNVKKTKSFQCVEDFEQARIGILTGSSHDNTAKELFPNASRVYFNNMSDMILAVEQGKIDGYLEDAPFVAPLNWEGIALKCVDGSVGQVSNGFVFPQGESTQLREQINEFIGEAKSDGTIEQLTQKWLGKTEPTEHPDYSTLTGENGTIHLAVSVDSKPMLYQNEDGYTGFEMELLTEFAQHYGYKFDIEIVPFESIIAGVSANKYDMGASSLKITDERKENVDFSDAYNTFEVVMVAKSGENKTYNTLSDLENATLGIITGTNYDALGYTRNKTFFRIIFPQAMTIFLPSYCGQAVELIKATAVVGYVAVNDLTKMGDIIRSNTYEAFFPLIATALIYFLLTWMFSLLLGLVKRRFEPKRRSAENILKGVKTI